MKVQLDTDMDDPIQQRKKMRLRKADQLPRECTARKRQRDTQASRP